MYSAEEVFHIVMQNMLWKSVM